MPYQPKQCLVCKKQFSPTSGKQWRCKPCSKAEKRPEKPPGCQCGCGEPVGWSRRHNDWSRFRHGHGVRVTDLPPATGHTPWNKGNETRYHGKCEWCGKKYRSKLADSRFCSRKCSGDSTRGENHPFWQGGVKTKYHQVQVDGKNYKMHRLVMKGLLGRKLKRREVVHHKDGDGMNNRPTNLHLFHCTACHSYYHTTDEFLDYRYSVVHD